MLVCLVIFNSYWFPSLKFVYLVLRLYDDGKILGPKWLFVPLVLDVLNRFDIHDLSSLVFKMVTLSEHVCTWFHYIVWISSCFMGDIGYIKQFVCTWFHYLVWISSCFMGDITSVQLDFCPLTTTLCSPPFRKLFIHNEYC